MSRRYLAFDIETAKDVPMEEVDWRQFRPLGIACAATWASDASTPTLWHGRTAEGKPAGCMSWEEAGKLVEHLVEQVRAGFTLLTWNGLGFDLDVLAEESGKLDACRELARQHVDMMFHVFCDRGFPVGLDKAAKGMQVQGKPAGMSGLLAPRLWAEGRHQEVLDYVTQDVRITLDVAQACDRKRAFVWLTRKGTPSRMPLAHGWLSVAEALELPQPDTSWMSSPLRRSNFTRWLGRA
jgi:hypothetical protein